MGWIDARRRLRRSNEARAKLRRVVELVKLAKVGTADELAAADAARERMTEWLFERLAAGEIEHDHFQLVERIIAQLRATVARRLGELAAAELPPKPRLERGLA